MYTREDIDMKKTADTMQTMMELNEERLGVQDALKAWHQWLDSEREGYYEDGPDSADELLEDDETGVGRALLETTMCLANAFQAKLAGLLGVPHQPMSGPGYGWLGKMTVTEPIGGGSDGITTTIWYASDYSHKDYAYELTMSKDIPSTSSAWPRQRKVVDYAHDTEQLVTLIGRGYMALRVMEGGCTHNQLLS